MTETGNRASRVVRGMYFSGTGTTRTIVTKIAQKLAERLAEALDGPPAGLPAETPDDTQAAALAKAPDIDFTPPAARRQAYRFDSRDIVVFGVPVIAGRVPNVLLPFLDTLEGGGAMAIPVVLYGNRNYDDALIELRDILEKRGFHTVAAAAFIGEHSFSRVLAAGRPDEKDLERAAEFAEMAAAKLSMLLEGFRQVEKAMGADKIGTVMGFLDRDKHDFAEAFFRRTGPVPVKGEQPLRPYYKPRDRQGNHINILKVKPKLDESKCTKCGICVAACPMGSIRPDAPGVVDGICIKCCGCEKKCPEGALYFDDPGYLYHKEELELGYPVRKEPELFL